MATHSSILAWRIPGTEEPSGLLSRGHTKSDTTEAAAAAEPVGGLESGGAGLLFSLGNQIYPLKEAQWRAVLPRKGDNFRFVHVEFEVPVETSWALNIFQIRSSDGPSKIFHLTL